MNIWRNKFISKMFIVSSLLLVILGAPYVVNGFVIIQPGVKGGPDIIVTLPEPSIELLTVNAEGNTVTRNGEAYKRFLLITSTGMSKTATASINRGNFFWVTDCPEAVCEFPGFDCFLCEGKVCLSDDGYFLNKTKDSVAGLGHIHLYHANRLSDEIFHALAIYNPNNYKIKVVSSKWATVSGWDASCEAGIEEIKAWRRYFDPGEIKTLFIGSKNWDTMFGYRVGKAEKIDETGKIKENVFSILAEIKITLEDGVTPAPAYLYDLVWKRKPSLLPNKWPDIPEVAATARGIADGYRVNVQLNSKVLPDGRILHDPIKRVPDRFNLAGETFIVDGKMTNIIAEDSTGLDNNGRLADVPQVRDPEVKDGDSYRLSYYPFAYILDIDWTLVNQQSIPLRIRLAAGWPNKCCNICETGNAVSIQYPSGRSVGITQLKHDDFVDFYEKILYPNEQWNARFQAELPSAVWYPITLAVHDLSSGSFVYNGENTNSALDVNNSYNQYIELEAGQLFKAGTCGIDKANISFGTPVVKMFDTKGIEISKNLYSKSCQDVGTTFLYRVPVSGTYLIRVGCQGMSRCGGTFVYSSLHGYNDGFDLKATEFIRVHLERGQNITASTCGLQNSKFDGNTLIKLKLPNLEVVNGATPEDSGCSYLTFTATDNGNYQLVSDCRGDSSCSGFVAYTIE